MRNLARVSIVASVTLCWAISANKTASAQGQANPPVNLPAVVELHRDVSPPLKDIEPEVPRRGPAHPIPLLHPAPGTGPGALFVDPALQTTLGPSVSTTAGLGFDGVGEGFHGYSVNVAPPDTNGAVGATQYVQWVNLSFAVFDKATGSLQYGPAAGNTIWSGFGGACQTTNDGDVIAQYDKQANRWVMAQLSYSQAPPYLLCLAVSTSDDATGPYYRYSFSYSGNLNDYPKLGVWPDGYYVTANMFKPRGFFGYTYQGPEVCALDRNSMLGGGASNPICNTLSSSYSSLLPADLDGTTLPPANSPNYLLSLGGNNSLYLWKFKPDFTSGTSTLSGPTTITVASYNQACGGGTCIPQLGTSQQLDSLGDRLMYRLAYRNFGDHESLVANHSVDAGGGVAGVRWYEIRNPGGTPTVYQQSTWSPDATYRWMGSIAMDHVGNIALGYSASSSSSNPSIYYTGHQPGVDGLGVMEAENNITVGTGSQQANLDRWGDYSSMSVDPADDCTFWYTTEYLKADGTFNWSTRIASFSFPSCTNGTSTANFSLGAVQSSATVAQGSSATYGITVTFSNGFSDPVDLSVGATCPPSATCSFSPASVTPGSPSSTLTVATATTVSEANATPAGNYNITVSGTSGSEAQTTTVQLAVTDFSLSASPSSQTVTQGTDATYTITAGSLNSFSGNVSLGVSGCPSGASCSVTTPVSVPSGGSVNATLTVSGTGAVSPGTYNGITVSGTSGGITHATSVSLTVNAPSAGDFSISASPGSLTLKSGQSGSYTVTIAPSNGFSANVTVGANCPSGFACQFSGGGLTTTIAGGSGSDSYTVANVNAAKRTSTTITFSASGGGQSHSTSVSLKAR